MIMRSHFVNAFILFLTTLLVLGGSAFAQYPGFGDPGISVGGGGQSGGFIPVEEQVDGGSLPTGATGQVVVRFRNESGQPVQTGLIRLYPSSTVTAEVSLNQCQEAALEPGAECAIALSIKGLQPGQWRVEMLMSHSGRSRLVTATLAGVVEVNGDSSGNLTSDIEAIPSDLDFGSLSSSQALTEHVILRNVTSKPIKISNLYIDTSEQAGYTMKSECEELQAGQACMVIVTWSPKIVGRSSGVLVVNHTGPAGLTSVALEGEYAPGSVSEAAIFPSAVAGKGLLVSSQKELNFGDAIETASAITVSLVNAGDSDLTLRDIKISGSDNGLSFKREGCAAGTVLAPVEACPLTVTWSPTRAGGLFDDVQIVHDGTRGVLVLPVRGTASAAVSQDQGAIVISGSDNQGGSGSGVDPLNPATPRPTGKKVLRSQAYRQGLVNPASVLDGYKITSFSPDRAIINGPGGSRIVFDNEEVTLGGVPWFVLIQQNGIEFLHRGQRVLLLFDRSLSAITGGSNAAAGSIPTATEDGN